MTWRSDSCGHLELVKSLKAGWMAGCNTGGNIIIILVWLVVGGGTNVWQLRTQDWCSSSLQSLLEVIEQWLHPRVMTPTNWRFIYFDNFISMDWRLLPILLAVLCVLDSISVLPWQIVDCQSSWFTFDSSWLSLDIAPGQVWVIAVKQTLCIYHRVSSPGYFHSSWAAILELSGKSQFSSLWAAADLRWKIEEEPSLRWILTIAPNCIQSVYLVLL